MFNNKDDGENKENFLPTAGIVILFVAVGFGAWQGMGFYNEYRSNYGKLEGQRAEIQQSIERVDEDIESIRSAMENINSLINKQNENMQRVSDASVQERLKLSSAIDKIKADIDRWSNHYIEALSGLNKMVQGLQTDIDIINNRKIIALQYEVEKMKYVKMPGMPELKKVEHPREAVLEQKQAAVLEEQASVPEKQAAVPEKQAPSKQKQKEDAVKSLLAEKEAISQNTSSKDNIPVVREQTEVPKNK